MCICSLYYVVRTALTLFKTVILMIGLMMVILVIIMFHCSMPDFYCACHADHYSSRNVTDC